MLVPKLNVCHRDGYDGWVGYTVIAGEAVVLASGSLTDLRAYATQTLFDGILFGSPSVEWADEFDLSNYN